MNRVVENGGKNSNYFNKSTPPSAVYFQNQYPSENQIFDNELNIDPENDKICNRLLLTSDCKLWRVPFDKSISTMSKTIIHT